MVRSARCPAVAEDSIHLRKKRTKAQAAVKPFCFFNFCSDLCGNREREITPKTLSREPALRWPALGRARSEFRHLLASKKFQRPRNLVRWFVAVKEAADFGTRHAIWIATQSGSDGVRSNVAQRIAENESARIFAVAPHLERRGEMRQPNDG